VSDPHVNRTYQKVYLLKGVTYVPHYVKDVFVGPGWSHKTGSGDSITYHPNIYTEQHLIAAGAQQSEMFLWERL
jgi:hypothetical protein